MTRRGFTIVELIVCAAIAGIVASLVVTGAAGSRQAAQRTACMSNLRQIGLGLIAYYEAHNTLPFAPVLYSLPEGRTDLFDALDGDTPTFGAVANGDGTLTPSKIARCPGDRYLAARSGTSYIYGAGLAMIAAEIDHRSRATAAMRVSRDWFSGHGPRRPLMADATAAFVAQLPEPRWWHVRPGPGDPRHEVYTDGSVDWAALNDAP